MDVVTLALLLVLLAWALHFFQKRRKWTKAVELLPGPPTVPILGNSWDVMWKYKFNMTDAYSAWVKTHGDLFRLWVGSNVVSVVMINPEDVEIVLSSNKHIDKSWIYRLVEPWIGTGLLTSGGQKWHTRRKLITPTFHFKILDEFMDVFNRNGSILVDKLLQTKGETTNVHALVTLCALDIICETAMGTKVNAQNDSTSPYVIAVNEAIIHFFQRSMKPWLHSDFMFKMSYDGKMFYKAVRRLHKYTQDVIQSRRLENESNKDEACTESDDMGIKKRVAFLDQLLKARDASGNALQDRDIQEEVDTFMFEGHDTTAAALSYTMFNIAANPEVQAKLVEEMNEIFGDSDRMATPQDIQAMRYTERVIKETLRLYPSVPTFSRSIKEDLAITRGRVIPAGCSVSINVYEMGRNAAYWPNPEKFDPDRFLPENANKRNIYAHVPFSAGPRNCIGQKFAMMELKSTVSKVVRSCKLSLPEPGYKPVVQVRAILKAPNGVTLRVSPR